MDWKKVRRRAAGILVAAGLALAVAGCDTLGYYYQSIGGHLGVMAQAQALDDAIAQAQASNDTRLAQRLALARKIRNYASRELKLPDNGSYRRYANLHRPYVVWSVFATPELSMTLHQWCFPIVGCISYRGYYAQGDAEHYAAGLRREGLETYVAGIPAYSTLGYFDDPLLNTFLYLPEGELARMVFHELAHQVVYVRNDTAFNESFATAVEVAGVERWLRDDARMTRVRATGSTTTAPAVPRAAARHARPARCPLSLRRGRRRQAPRQGGDLRQPAQPVCGVAHGVGRLQRLRPLVRPAPDQRPSGRRGHVPAMGAGVTALLDSVGGDWTRFYAEARRIGDLPPDERHAALRKLAPPAVNTGTLNAEGRGSGPGKSGY